MATVSAHVAVALTRCLDRVFRVMGTGNAHFLDAIERGTDATFVAVRHEAGGVVAADAHYRVCGRLAAATSTYGPGFTNTLTPLAEAAQARIPLLLVVGDAPASGPRPWDVDQIALASAVGVRTYTVGVRDAAATALTALEHSRAQRKPAVVAIPYDMASCEIGPVPDLPLPPPPAPAIPTGPVAEAALDRIAEGLAGAQRALLLAGRGAWLADAGAVLGELAAQTGAVTASSALGRGIFPEDRYDLGVTGGLGAHPAMTLVREADVAVVFGTSLNPFLTRFGELFAPGTQVFQVDIAPTATHPQVNGYVRGDAAEVARLVLERLRRAGAAASGWRESVDVRALRSYDRGDGLAPDGRLDPRTAAARIGELLPDDRVVVSDSGHFLGWANMHWPVASPDRMVMVGTAFQSIGQGFPSVVGAAAARPESTIVLTTGEGGGLMAIADLESAIRAAGGRGLAVVWNDAAYGAEITLYGTAGPRTGADAHSGDRLRRGRAGLRRRRRRRPHCRRFGRTGRVDRARRSRASVPAAGSAHQRQCHRTLLSGDHPHEILRAPAGPARAPRAQQSLDETHSLLQPRAQLERAVDALTAGGVRAVAEDRGQERAADDERTGETATRDRIERNGQGVIRDDDEMTGEAHARLTAEGLGGASEVVEWLLVAGKAGADEFALRDPDLAAPIGGADGEEAGGTEDDVIQLGVGGGMDSDIAPEGEADSEARHSPGCGLLGESGGQQPADLARRRAHQARIVRVGVAAAAHPLPHEGEEALAGLSAGMAVAAGAHGSAAGGGTGGVHGGAEPAGGRLAGDGVHGEALAAVVASAGIRIADQLPGGLNGLEPGGGPARVRMGLARKPPVGPAQVLLAHGRADAEGLVGARRGRTVAHGFRH